MQHSRLLLSLFCASVLTACAGTTTNIQLATTADLHCGAIPSVTVVDDVLAIGAGEKPTPGYSIVLAEQSRKGDHVSISYEISSPRQGAILPQMMTSPCSRITLPGDWQRLTVENNETGQQWVFDNSASSAD